MTVVAHARVSLEAQMWAAQQVVRQHREPQTDERATGRCAQCRPPAPCLLLAGALALLPPDADFSTGRGVTPNL
jgi:hypothetical protein